MGSYFTFLQYSLNRFTLKTGECPTVHHLFKVRNFLQLGGTKLNFAWNLILPSHRHIEVDWYWYFHLLCAYEFDMKIPFMFFLRQRHRHVKDFFRRAILLMILMVEMVDLMLFFFRMYRAAVGLNLFIFSIMVYTKWIRIQIYLVPTCLLPTCLHIFDRILLIRGT